MRRQGFRERRRATFATACWVSRGSIDGGRVLFGIRRVESWGDWVAMAESDSKNAQHAWVPFVNNQGTCGAIM